MKNNVKLPAHYAIMSHDELAATTGGGAVDTAAKAVVAVSVSGVLLCVAAVAANGILSIFGFGGGDTLIGSAVSAGREFITDSVEAGRSFLSSLLS